MRQEPVQRTGIRRAARVAAVVFAAGAVAAGCSGGSHPGADSTGTTPTSAASASSAPVSNTSWNPCSLPDADIAAAGLNPARKVADTGTYGTKFPGWDVCGWLSDSWYSLNVFSTNAHTFDEVVHNTRLFRDPRPVTVGDRAAVLLPSAIDPQVCNVAVDTSSGPVQFEVDAKASADTPGDSCAEATRIAGVLAKDLPAGK
ncbi:DUF3558 family protein [Nocardia transvalensis]|uniref:DUF3558 family protein n=1 Tax=Nocardia transvalensis TaxID=37333 RepID=UPI001894A6F8|nr:DUF3558 family protein [Nocardia transvalensis]MBF6333610.1 DUF3558 domain-containing protein [Nocardia transvalensis]